MPYYLINPCQNWDCKVCKMQGEGLKLLGYINNPLLYVIIISSSSSSLFFFNCSYQSIERLLVIALHIILCQGERAGMWHTTPSRSATSSQSAAQTTFRTGSTILPSMRSVLLLL